MTRLRLGVNIDHVATIRNARGVAYPDPARAAVVALEAGADDFLTKPFRAKALAARLESALARRRG